jgi:hypothetical protein
MVVEKVNPSQVGNFERVFRELRPDSQGAARSLFNSVSALEAHNYLNSTTINPCGGMSSTI